MNNKETPNLTESYDLELLKEQLQHILAHEPLEELREIVADLTLELAIDLPRLAAALLHRQHIIQPTELSTVITERVDNVPNAMKMVRYRLDIGSEHQVTLDDIKRVLVEESGVDKNNINNVSIRHQYTLIELPDAMPPDIFQLLKTVEINNQKLDIRRVKIRNKKRSIQHGRRGKTRNPKPQGHISDPL
jgi:hypothetical protein